MKRVVRKDCQRDVQLAAHWAVMTDFHWCVDLLVEMPVVVSRESLTVVSWTIQVVPKDLVQRMMSTVSFNF
jgi:hypothetical protein